VLPTNGGAPIVTVLSDPTHSALLSRSERGILDAWVSAGAPKSSGATHGPSFADPRSAGSHGRMLRAKHWSPMLDPNDAASCGRCHDGAPSRPADVTASVPNAPACTTCHTEPGALGCNTCHGQGAGETSRAVAYPPRDVCFFPEDSAIPPAHALHADATPAHANGLPCSTCHPAPGDPVIAGTHGNGTVEVLTDAALSFDPATKTCTNSCHARGGARPKPAWTETTPMGCGDCHASPPAGHFAGSCTGCHREANATGTAFLVSPVLHINGKVDLGDGSGKCGACHGTGDDPWPSTNAHPGHQAPVSASAAPCTSCHVVPTAFGVGTDHPRGGSATVAFSGLAVTRGAPAAYSGGSCRAVYCHGAGLEGSTAATPAWADTSGVAQACGACHTTPPPAPHPASPACSLCHDDGLVTPSGPQIAPAFAKLHINGVVDRGNN
jgi:predicted CxxxxCH...CXXCH cytochrome family protein